MNKIVIGIEHGMAYIIHNPTNLPIVIKDYDTDGMTEEEYDIKTDENGQKYTELEMEKK